MSSDIQENLKECLPSHLFKEIRNMPSAKGRRKIIREGTTPEGTVRNRHPSSVHHGLDETDFVLMGETEMIHPQEEIRHMATSLDRKKTVL